MTWLAPWAFVGLAAVALPVLVHWLARHEADRRVFPTVRFLPRTPPTSVRRHRLTDVALLALRAAIVATAVAALAAPALVRPPAAAGAPPRAVVVDTSASMGRPGADGRPGDALAVDAVAALAPGDRDVVIHAADLRHGVAQAGAWLRARPAAGDVVIVSDFQVGAIEEADLDVVPASAGRRFVRVAVGGAVPAPPRGGVRVDGAPLADAAAKKTSGDISGVGQPEMSPDVILSFRASLTAQARPLDSPALYTLAREIDPEMTAGTFLSLPAPDGQSAALAIVTDLPPDSIEAAALIARAYQAAARPAIGAAEREPDVLPQDVLDDWQRDPRPELAPATGVPQPLGRWLWAIVLVLLALETWVRRRSRPATHASETEVRHARVA